MDYLDYIVYIICRLYYFRLYSVNFYGKGNSKKKKETLKYFQFL